MVDERENRAGHHWRLLAHRQNGERVEVSNDGVLDELVVDDWLHFEKIDEGKWWARIGDARVVVSVAGEEGETNVDVTRGFYDLVRGSTDEHVPPAE